MSKPVTYLWPSMASSQEYVAKAQLLTPGQPMYLTALGGGPVQLTGMQRTLYLSTQTAFTTPTTIQINGTLMSGERQSYIVTLTNPGPTSLVPPRQWANIASIICLTGGGDTGPNLRVGLGPTGWLAMAMQDVNRRAWYATVQADVLPYGAAPSGSASYTLVCNLLRTAIPNPTPQQPYDEGNFTPTPMAGVPADIPINPANPPITNADSAYGRIPYLNGVGTYYFPIPGTTANAVAPQIASVPFPVAIIGAGIQTTAANVGALDQNFSMQLTILQQGIV